MTAVTSPSLFDTLWSAPEAPPADDLPILVYGTLRPGWGNARRWQGRGIARHDGQATVAGYRLVAGPGFPYAVPAPGETIVGALVVPYGDCYAEVLRDLDWLEGVPNHYERVAVTASTPVGDVRAWLYTPGGETLAEVLLHDGHRTVPGNDWSRWRRGEA